MGLTGLGIPRKLVELCSGCVSVSRAALPSEQAQHSETGLPWTAMMSGFECPSSPQFLGLQLQTELYQGFSGSETFELELRYAPGIPGPCPARLLCVHLPLEAELGPIPSFQLTA